MKLQNLNILSSGDIESAFRAAAKERADAVLVLPGPVFNAQRTELATLAVKASNPSDVSDSRFTSKPEV